MDCDLGQSAFAGRRRRTDGTAAGLTAEETNVGRDAEGRLTGLLQEAAAPKLGHLLRQLPLTKLLAAFLLARDKYLAA